MAQSVLIDFVLKEWLLIASAAGLIVTSAYTKQLPPYSAREFEVLFILLSLFVAIRGLERSGGMSRISEKIERGRGVGGKLVLTTFFLSMLITNDAALIAIVPLTLSLKINRQDWLVILEALAANAGSALTPFGNPQNLYIYLYYDLDPAEFFRSIALLSLFFLVLLLGAALVARNGSQSALKAKNKAGEKKSALIYVGFLFVVLLAILRLFPVWAAGLVLLYAVVKDRRSLFVDYALLFSFFFFFGMADNLQSILKAALEHSRHVFLLSALASQIMSNVPATLLLAKFTTNWKALLWGSNVGGFGSLFGSLANLIAYKFYIVSRNSQKEIARFTVRFLVIGYVAFFLAVGLYFFMRWISV